MSVSVCLCVCVCLSATISSELHVRSSPNFMLVTAVAQSFSGGVVICYVLPFIWMTSRLLISQDCRRRRPAEAQCIRSLGLGCKLCAVIPVAGQRKHGTTFRTLKVTFHVATQGAESAVYDCLVGLCTVVGVVPLCVCLWPWLGPRPCDALCSLLPVS